MSLDLDPEIENMLRERAANAGLSVNDLLARMFALNKLQISPPADAQAHVRALLTQWQAEDNTPLRPSLPTRHGETPTQALFRKWKEEDSQITEEEQEAEDRLWEDIERSLKENGRILHLRDIRR